MLTPLQQLLLLCGLAGMILGVLLTLAGLHELSHRTRTAGYSDPDDDTAEFPPVLAEPRRAAYWRSSR